jgi:hypothetical protein
MMPTVALVLSAPVSPTSNINSDATASKYDTLFIYLLCRRALAEREEGLMYIALYTDPLLLPQELFCDNLL